MTKYWGYEAEKLLKTPLIIFLIGLPFLIITLNIHFSNTRFLSSFISWMRVSKSRHIFDYFVGKSAFFNAIVLSFLVVILIYFIFYREYKSGTMTKILFSKSTSKNIYKEKSIIFVFIILAYILYYFLLISGYSYYFILEYPGMLAGQSKFFPVFFLEHIVVYLVFTLRTLFLTLVYFKFFKANASALALAFALQIICFFYPILPFTWLFNVDLGFTLVFMPALGFLFAFYLLNIKLNES